MASFVVVPSGRRPEFGFWLEAESSEEARLLVALNVPDMGGVTNPAGAECTLNETHLPMRGLIIEGFGRSYTITRRRDKSAGRT